MSRIIASIHDITNDELSLWIADKHEPQPDVTGLEGIDPVKIGQTGVWVCAFPYENDDEATVVPRDMVEDPEMTIMLTNWLIENGYSLHIWRGDMPRVTIAVHDEKYLYLITPLGRAIAEAWALVNGWKTNVQT